VSSNSQLDLIVVRKTGQQPNKPSNDACVGDEMHAAVTALHLFSLWLDLSSLQEILDFRYPPWPAGHDVPDL
jgi:hypothetical protein